MIDLHQAAPDPAPTAGVDWASESMPWPSSTLTGSELERFTVAHTAAGLRQLVRRLQRAGVGRGRDRTSGRAGGRRAARARALTVLVIAPNQVKNLRSRYGSAGNKDDGFDAYVLADTVRTDRAPAAAADA